MKGKNMAGHLSALLTIIIWGATFISTKILLADFQPVEILFFRFVMGLLVLLIVYPRRLKGTNRQQELTFAAAGLCGICLYYLLENIALTYTMASNVGVIISVAPFFTAILSHLFLKEEKPHASFFIGFVVAMAGIALISFNGSKLELNPTGDFLALLAALIWACYSVLTKKISGFCADKENQWLRLQYHPHYPAGVLLRYPVYAPDTVPVRFQTGIDKVCKSCVSVQHSLFGIGRIGPVLCHLEFRGQGAGSGQNERLYLHGSRDYGSDFRGNSP